MRLAVKEPDDLAARTVSVNMGINPMAHTGLIT
jgi:hypothetical protein